jgi:hypothetical protein
MRSLLNKKKKKNAHPYDRCIKWREVQDAILRRSRKKRQPITLPEYGTETGVNSRRPRPVDRVIHTYESADEDRIGEYVVPEDEEIARFGESISGRSPGITCHST